MDLSFKTNKEFMDVEFRLNQSETSYHGANHESKFLNENLFGLFASCFAKSVDHDNQFNYYGPTKYRKNELLKLRTCLSEIEVELKSASSFEAFSQFIEKDEFTRHVLRILEEQFDLDSEWDQILQKIIEVNRELINLVSRCIRERQILWVLGI